MAPCRVWTGRGQVSERMRRTYSTAITNAMATRPTDTGTMELAIPKLRQESYFPEWLSTRRRRAERALISVAVVTSSPVA